MWAEKEANVHNFAQAVAICAGADAAAVEDMDRSRAQDIRQMMQKAQSTELGRKMIQIAGLFYNVKLDHSLTG